jgi:dihydrofolate synthase/folylpolyglutamate synthase
VNYAQAIRFLYDLRLFGAKFGLDNTLKLAELVGHPQARLRFIHVAGTNGKGSTCAMLEAAYRAAGYRVGLFTSPHLVSFNERIQVNRQPISEADVCQLVAELRPLVAAFPEAHSPTFFEAVTVMALRYFERQGCDLVIWETGLGGRLDATNIVTTLASVITNIGWDHQQWLGNTLSQIASEKAGIIKPGIPVLTGAEGEALEVIAALAEARQAPLTVATPQSRAELPLPSLTLPGRHQRGNAALAWLTVAALQSVLPVPASALLQGLQSVAWPGRFQVVKLAGRVLLLDGAHNAPGACTLRAAVEEYYPGRRPAFIVGILQDKNVEEICRELAPVAGRVVVVPVASERTAAPAAMVAAWHRVAPGLPVSEARHLREALDLTAAEPLVVLAGSLYLIGEAMETLGLSTAPSPGERSLNEWGGLDNIATNCRQT